MHENSLRVPCWRNRHQVISSAVPLDAFERKLGVHHETTMLGCATFIVFIVSIITTTRRPRFPFRQGGRRVRLLLVLWRRKQRTRGLYLLWRANSCSNEEEPRSRSDRQQSRAFPWAPCDAGHGRFRADNCSASPSLNFPDAYRPILPTARKPLSAPVTRNRPNRAVMALESAAQRRRKRLQIRWLGQRRQEAGGVDVDSLLARARAEVEVEASIETLMNKTVVRWNTPHRVENFRNESNASRALRILLHRLSLLLRRQIFFRGVVALLVPGQFCLRSRDVRQPGTSARRLSEVRAIIPEHILFWLLRRFVAAHLEPTAANRTHESHNLLRLPLARQETTFRLWCVREGMKTCTINLGPVDHLLLLFLRLGSQPDARKLTATDASKHANLFFRKSNLLIVHLVVKTTPRRWIVSLGQQPCQQIRTITLRELLTLPVVANVLLLVIPTKWNVTDCIARFTLIFAAVAPRVGCKRSRKHPSRVGAARRPAPVNLRISNLCVLMLLLLLLLFPFVRIFFAFVEAYHFRKLALAIALRLDRLGLRSTCAFHRF
mmetsp:Transcript_22967/g.74834  ORF Transcript_22967/g.74834 Transcript_22967/m.74834 type:complete len:549 (+) Transcript_22967:606-2252(+)